jgi:aminomethyltransferase
LETLVPVDVIGLPAGKQRYALFTNDQGGILDDLMIFNTGSYLHLVVNAACKAQDIAHLKKHLGNRCEIRVRDDLALLALQGPGAEAALASIAKEVASIPQSFMQGGRMLLAGIDCLVTRSGYTGEDGFEISVPNSQCEALAKALLAAPNVQAIGLGARDSLRLEAGLCLYGHDLDTTTTPVEAALTWAIQKVRRTGGARAGSFPGAATILAQLDDPSKVKRKRVGIKPEGRAPIREGVELQNEHGQKIGIVTSGGFAPSVNAPIVMGYVDTNYVSTGTKVNALLRGNRAPVTVADMPFSPHGYKR